MSHSKPAMPVTVGQAIAPPKVTVRSAEVSDEAEAGEARGLSIAWLGASDPLDPIRYWLAMDGTRRVGRICTIRFADGVAAILGLWVEAEHREANEARRLLLCAAYRGVFESGCVKLVVESSITRVPPWKTWVRSGALTLRCRRPRRFWREYYVNIYCDGLQTK